MEIREAAVQILVPAVFYDSGVPKRLTSKQAVPPRCITRSPATLASGGLGSNTPINQGEILASEQPQGVSGGKRG